MIGIILVVSCSPKTSQVSLYVDIDNNALVDTINSASEMSSKLRYADTLNIEADTIKSTSKMSSKLEHTDTLDIEVEEPLKTDDIDTSIQKETSASITSKEIENTDEAYQQARLELIELLKAQTELIKTQNEQLSKQYETNTNNPETETETETKTKTETKTAENNESNNGKDYNALEDRLKEKDEEIEALYREINNIKSSTNSTSSSDTVFVNNRIRINGSQFSNYQAEILSQEKEILRLKQQLENQTPQDSIGNDTLTVAENKTEINNNSYYNSNINSRRLKIYEDSIQNLSRQLDSLNLQLNDTAIVTRLLFDTTNIVTTKDSAILLNLQQKNRQIKTLESEIMAMRLQKQITPDTIRIETIDTVFLAPEKTENRFEFTLQYNRGLLQPSNEQAFFQAAKSVFQNENLNYILLSGHTDNSGSTVFNRKITYKRLQYIRKKISERTDDASIFEQNFADEYASKEIIELERRVEILIVY
ncbi:MAG: hypothetical protein U9N51_11745 [Bacteroidota bacterium]|nr:hypothetical protein [Bacteroidota bacterium]